MKGFLLCSGIALVCGVASEAGYALLDDAFNFVLAFVQAFGGGAILMMLANTMIPEAYEHAGKLAGVATVIGFAVAVVVVVLEHAGACFRHTFASHLVMRGGPLKVVQ